MTPVKARAAKILDEIIEQIAKEQGLSCRKVELLLNTVFSKIAEDIRSGSLQGTHVLHLGKFKPKPFNIERFYKNQEKYKGIKKWKSLSK